MILYLNGFTTNPIRDSIGCTLILRCESRPELLKKTIDNFIFSQPKTTTQRIKKHFNLTYSRNFYALFNRPDKLKDTIEKFCVLCNIEIIDFKKY